MKKVKMIKLEDGNYVPEQCCSYARNFETGILEIDDIDLPCGADCGGQCQNCVVQDIMNDYAALKAPKKLKKLFRFRRKHTKKLDITEQLVALSAIVIQQYAVDRQCHDCTLWNGYCRLDGCPKHWDVSNLDTEVKHE